MSDDEVAAFRENRNLDDILQVRFWDEDGKDPDLKTPPFEHYAPVLQRVVDRFCAGKQ